MSDVPKSPLRWTEDGQPRSAAFGDVYFSAEDGLAESRAVFLAGCGLPQAWENRRRFVVGELGFGTGLNVAALLDLWCRTRPTGGILHIFSLEAFPITAAEAARTLARWPELADITELMIERWPGRARGVHRVEFPELGAILDLAVMDVEEALDGWTGEADAWFLDGFAPAQNPQMWSDAVLTLVKLRSAEGARVATFTVAGQVRRALSTAGFTVAKRTGFGRKRERLEARLAGSRPHRAPSSVAIVGGGIAGAAASRAVRALGGNAVVFEAVSPGAGGSGNPAALVTPRLDASLGDLARLSAQAFSRAINLYATLPEAIIARGVRQLVTQPRDAARFAKIAGSDMFEPDALAADKDGLDQLTALVVEPVEVLLAWLDNVRPERVAAIRPLGTGVRLLSDVGVALGDFDAVIIAAGLASRALIGDLPLEPVRGQASWVEGEPPVAAAAWGGYVLPMRRGVLFGATHDRGDAGVDLRAGDHVRNLEALASRLPELAVRLSPERLGGRASIRAVTPDRLPIAGWTGPSATWALTGFGSRGFAFAPLLAEHVAALALGAPSPIPRRLAALIDPGRFAAGRGRIRSSREPV